METNKKKLDQLTKDSISAQKAGMSYGRYMAMKPQKGYAPKVETEEEWPVCKVCGKVMVDVRKDRMYCSPECTAYIKSIKSQERYRKKVAQCG